MNSNDQTELNNNAWDFLKEEQKQRFQEIQHMTQVIESDQRNGLIIIGAIWAWLVTNRGNLQPPFNKFAALIAPLIIVFFWCRLFSYELGMKRTTEYTRILESSFGLPKKLGWERHLQSVRNEMTDKILRSSFWLVLLASNILLSILFINLS